MLKSPLATESLSYEPFNVRESSAATTCLEPPSQWQTTSSAEPRPYVRFRKLELRVIEREIPAIGNLLFCGMMAALGSILQRTINGSVVYAMFAIILCKDHKLADGNTSFSSPLDNTAGRRCDGTTIVSVLHRMHTTLYKAMF